MFSTLRNIVLLLFIFAFVQDFVAASRREFPTCRSRDTCIRLTQCAPYMNLIKSLRKPLSRAAVLFLRKQECGFDGMYPMVCCFPSNIRRTQGNRFQSVDNEYTTKTPTYYVPSFHDTHYNHNEGDEETYRAPKKPDLTPGDLSDYRSFKVQNTKLLAAPAHISKVPEDEQLLIETSSSKSNMENVKTTTKLFRRKGDYMRKATVAPPVKVDQSEEARNEKAEKIKRKMEAINNAFMYSTMDFFVRRMYNENNQ